MDSYKGRIPYNQAQGANRRPNLSQVDSKGGGQATLVVLIGESLIIGPLSEALAGCQW